LKLAFRKYTLAQPAAKNRTRVGICKDECRARPIATREVAAKIHSLNRTEGRDPPQLPSAVISINGKPVLPGTRRFHLEQNVPTTQSSDTNSSETRDTLGRFPKRLQQITDCPAIISARPPAF
jgi:hypothetical protein